MLGASPAAGIVRSRDDDAAARSKCDNRRSTVRGGSVNGVGIGYRRSARKRHKCNYIPCA